MNSLIINSECIAKELSLCHKLKFSNPYIFGTWCCRLLIFQTKMIWCIRIHSLKFLRCTNWVAEIYELENQSLCQRLNSFIYKHKLAISICTSVSLLCVYNHNSITSWLICLKFWLAYSVEPHECFKLGLTILSSEGLTKLGILSYQLPVLNLYRWIK